MLPMLGSGGFRAQARLRAALSLAAILALGRAVTPAGAQAGGDISWSASAGFDGYIKLERWVPVRVELANDGPDAEVLVEVFPKPAPPARASEYSQSVALASGARKNVTLHAYPTGGTGSLLVRLSVQGRLVSQTDLPVINLWGTDTLVGVMAADPTSFNVIRNPMRGVGANRVETALLSAETLPDRGPALSALDALIICDHDTGAMTPAQLQALEAWVASGGRLLVCGGPNWRKTTAGLTGLLPIDITGTQRVASLESVGSYLNLGAGPQGEAILAVGKPGADAETLIEQANFPLVLARRFGLGQVVFLAADPTLAPLSAWPALQVMYRALFLEGPYAQAGIWGPQDDAAARAASLFPNLSLPPIGAVCGFLVLYTFALGPLHYLLLRRAKRRELAWITIPALVVTFSAAAFGVGSLSRGSRPVVNRMAVVHVPAGAERAPVRGVLGIFSPNRSKLGIEFASGILARPLAERYSLADGDWRFHQGAEGSGETEMQFDAASVRGLVFDGDIAAPGFSHSLSAEVAGSTLLVQGQVVSLDLPLEDAALLTPYGAVSLGDLSLGEPRKVRESFSLMVVPPEADYAMMSVLGAVPAPYSYGALGSNEIKLMQRGALLEAIGLGYGATVPGIYLVGWSDRSPLEPFLNRASDSDDLTLYLVELAMAQGPGAPPLTIRPEVISAPTVTPAVVVLGPGQFAWQVVEADTAGPTPSPYGGQVMQGAYVLRFIPAMGVSYSSVGSLTLHVRGGSNGPGPENFIELWDWNAAAWEAIPGLQWGDNQIPDPWDYVGPEAEIRLRVHAEGGVVVSLELSAFTLVLEP